MQKHFRWLPALLTILVLILALAACGGQQEVVGEEQPTAEAPAEETAAEEAPAEEAAAEETPAEEAAADETPAEEAEATAEPAEEAAAEESEAAAPEGDVIKLGALAPLSAPGTVVGGEAMVDAMRIAEDEINANGGLLGRPVELIIEDSEGLPERGAAAMEKLINQDGVVAIGGGYHSSVGVAAKEVAHNNGIPVVFAETWNDTITG
ncbi:MAG: ABC transporter substrate-binding protein, partial [Caldilineaceae bacterium]|nr:ABC transporter substrate-binding protein [Caldilineaceae bacterium]